MKKYNNFYEMENTVLGFCDEEVVFGSYEDEDYVSEYINNIFTYYIQEMITSDICANGFDEDLIDRIGDIIVIIPDELKDFYRDAVDLNSFDIPEEKKTVPVKMDKHQVYKLIADNQENFLTCAEIEKQINKCLKEKSKAPAVSISLSAPTLSAMVRDGVMERKFNETKWCYTYRPILPINEEYKAS